MKRVFIFLMVFSLLTVTLSSCGMGSLSDLENDVVDKQTEINESVTSEYSTISDSLDACQFMIFDEVYNLPITYADFVSKGWTPLKQISDEELPAESYLYVNFVKNNVTIGCKITNFDISNKIYSDCYITKVEYEYGATNSTNFIVPGNIKVNESSYDDVISTYGDSGYLYEGKYSISLTYDFLNDLKTIDFDFDLSSKILTKVTISNEQTPSDFVSSVVNTDSYMNYTAPANLGTGVSDKVFSYDGKLYSLPCPLSEFLDNGWEIYDDTDANDVLGSHKKEYVLLSYKDDFRTTDYSGNDINKALFNYNISVNVYNFASDARSLKNCCVCSVDFITYNGSYDLFSNRFGYIFDLSSKTNFVNDIESNKTNFDISSSTEDGSTTDIFKYSEDCNVVVNDETYECSYSVKIFFTDGKLSRFYLSLTEN